MTTSTRTSSLIRAASVAALLFASLLAPHAATAETPRNSAAPSVAFIYKPDAPAAAIYAHLQATARDACADHGSRSLRLAQHAAACAHDLLDKAVAKIDRADLASLHGVTPAPLTLAAR